MKPRSFGVPASRPCLLKQRQGRAAWPCCETAGGAGNSSWIGLLTGAKLIRPCLLSVCFASAIVREPEERELQPQCQSPLARIAAGADGRVSHD